MSDNNNGIVEITSSKRNVDPEIKISNLRFTDRLSKNAGEWGCASIKTVKKAKISKKGLESLRRNGIYRVEHLHGLSVDALERFSGIGEVSAKRLIRAAKKANITTRGRGYPWKLEIDVPLELAKWLGDRPISKDMVKEAVENMLSEETNSVSKTIKNLLIESEKRKIEKIKNKIKELEDL